MSDNEEVRKADRVYITSPYSGDVAKHQAYARACMVDSLRRGEAPFVPHLLYTQVLDDASPEEREKGMQAGEAMLFACDKLVVYEDLGISDGMAREMKTAFECNIKIEPRKLGDWAALQATIPYQPFDKQHGAYACGVRDGRTHSVMAMTKKAHEMGQLEGVRRAGLIVADSAEGASPDASGMCQELVIKLSQVERELEAKLR